MTFLQPSWSHCSRLTHSTEWCQTIFKAHFCSVHTCLRIAGSSPSNEIKHESLTVTFRDNTILLEIIWSSLSYHFIYSMIYPSRLHGISLDITCATLLSWLVKKNALPGLLLSFSPVAGSFLDICSVSTCWEYMWLYRGELSLIFFSWPYILVRTFMIATTLSSKIYKVLFFNEWLVDIFFNITYLFQRFNKININMPIWWQEGF